MSLKEARLAPLEVSMSVEPTVLRVYTLMLLRVPSRLKMLVWQSRAPGAEQAEGVLVLT